ncbi:ATP-dependent DNA helicase DinG [Evansella cellulosilytica]|uniref:3'-5' exonuclease DinG n=1 Tax=Evansella cellulosilytica (strain ATCC 21833 / DSM 2522 / FERM P-1141 / JCM 9156 / N-4) TaxID=649639 RepID=E6TZJ5_EVAC2|nr:ATP-dependent DNA helicase DinG [Evansella cellulosilytica]ADU30169.1 DnaQ family exonuclease/DinG family helicase [Evansella cellulosilytica DSM 2522]
MERFVIVDVETTGVSFIKGDRIIQIAFVVIEGKKIIDRFNSYVNPMRDIPPFIRSLTNINDNEVKDAPTFDLVAPRLLQALDGAFFVAHNVDFDLSFINEELHALGYTGLSGPVIDTVELSKIAYPTADGFRLSQLSESLHMNHDQPHRADSDAEATALIFLEIMDKLYHLPKQTLIELNNLSTKLKSDIGSIIQEWIMEKETCSDDKYDHFQGLVLKKREKILDNEQMEEVDKILFHNFYESNIVNTNWWQNVMEGYEVRAGQTEMMTYIYETMEERAFGLIEAGTGTGKTLAYLLPAAFLAKEKQKKVIISTQTIQLQEQLIKKEVPTLERLLPFPIHVVILKGRSHYLCLQKFARLLQEDHNDAYDRTVSKAQILVWLLETKTGDVEELSLASHSNRFWNDIASDAYSCNSSKCAWFSRCFYQHARNDARKADLIITNHSLILADILTSNQLIPKYDYAILDEAHHLEDTATEQFGQQLDYLSLTHLINRMGSKRGEGLLRQVYDEIYNDYRDTVEKIEETGTKVKFEWYELFLLLNDYVINSNTNFNERGRATVKINAKENSWYVIEEAARRCKLYLEEWLANINRIVDILETIESNYNDAFTSFIDRVEGVYSSLIKLLLEQDDHMIYWIEADTKGPKQAIYIKGRPINVSESLADLFFQKKDSVILTSATLTVNNKFNYMIRRLGLSDFYVKTKHIDSPFHWDKQVKLMVPTDMPLIQDAGEKAYAEATVMQIYRIAEITKGKMLVLFTSYDMLKNCYNYLKEMLDDEYAIIAQGVHSGNRTKLTKNFQQFNQAILLGTSSFWEGVDIPGSDLSIIVIVRLPFTPPDDPVFQAKSTEMKREGLNPFMKLALPQAILRFKQGFGRLVRTTHDRGAVIVLDRRITNTKYGKLFIKSLPEIPLVEKSLDELEDDILSTL